jgi:hypothetical protein
MDTTTAAILPEAVAALTQTSAPPPLRVTAFDAKGYAALLANQVGILDLTDIPAEVMLELVQGTDKNAVNQVFFKWFEARPKAELTLTDADKELFANIISVKSTQEYLSTVKARDVQLRNAVDATNSVQSYLRSMMEYQEKIDRLDGKSSWNLTETIKKAVADGWYTYDSELTSRYNSTRLNHRDHGLVFTTPHVQCKYVNQAAGINKSLDFGRYQVVYVPSNGMVFVLKLENNINVDGYYHPHVTTSGSVCWGNGANAMGSAVKLHKVDEILQILRVILENYNADSPYISYIMFEVRRDPSKMRELPTRFSQEGDAWVRESNLPAYTSRTNILDTREDDDGETEVLLPYYVRIVSDSGDIFPDDYDGDENTHFYLYTSRVHDDTGQRYARISRDEVVEFN